MKEKGRLAGMAAVFLGLSIFCWGTALWSGKTDFVAAGSLPEVQPAAAEGEPSALEEASSLPDESEHGAASSDPVSSAPDAYLPLTEEEACLLAECLTAAGTPFFESVSELSVPELETAAIWWGMESGKMPACEDGVVTLPAEEVLGWIEKLFGLREFAPADCSLAAYELEGEVFVLPAAAVFPAFYPVVSSPQAVGEETRIGVSMLSIEDWEGDVMGNIYLPETLLVGILVLENGAVSAWQEG